MEQIRRYPIGIQNFANIRNRKCVYIDKTDIIYNLIQTSETCFLSRPRRFGKSLLVSTMEAYFLGKKKLFSGLAMEQLEQEWTVRPVFHIDFSKTKYFVAEKLDKQLDIMLSNWEEIYGTKNTETTYEDRFAGLIKRAYEQTGQQVAVLIDEYDAPLLDSIDNQELQTKLRNIMRGFFSPLKASGEYIRFLFLTGITKFSQLSIFSELNNLKNISMDDRYCAICGITDTEVLTQLKPDISALAEYNDETYDEACAHLKKLYDGYHFSENSEDIYNPFSLFSALDARKYGSYWYSTGTPTFLVELIKKTNYNILDLEGTSAQVDDFDRSTDSVIDITPVLYQSGYITIKDYDKRIKAFTLGYPNEEVRHGFLNSLVPSILNTTTIANNRFIIGFVTDINNGDIEGFLNRAKSFFASIPYDLDNKSEKHYQTIFYILFTLMGQIIDVEVKSAIGRADVVMKTAEAIYVLEFKVDGTPEEAIAQIESRQYAIPYAVDSRKVVKVGINFDSATRTVGSWLIR